MSRRATNAELAARVFFKDGLSAALSPFRIFPFRSSRAGDRFVAGDRAHFATQLPVNRLDPIVAERHPSRTYPRTCSLYPPRVRSRTRTAVHPSSVISFARRRNVPAVRPRWGTSSMSRRVWLLTRSKPSNSNLPRTRCNGASHGSAVVCDQARFSTRGERLPLHLAVRELVSLFSMRPSYLVTPVERSTSCYRSRRARARQCPLLGATRKTYARTEFFSV